VAEPLADITSHDTYVHGVPRETFRYLRENDPVHWTKEPDGGRGFWSLTTYDDVLFASRNTDIFSSRLGIRLEDMDPEETEARRTLMEMDSPEHTRLRRLVSRPFAPKTVNEYEDAVRELSIEVLDSLKGEREFNFVQRVARELPMRMLGRLLGLPDEDLDWLVLRGDALIGNSDPDFTEFVVDQVDTSEYRLLPFRSPVALELFEYATHALEERRITPTHDILSALLEPTADGESLDDLALMNFFTLMVAAGNDTTRYTMTGGLLALIERPEIFAKIPSMTLEERKSLVDEMLRWTTVTMHFRRTVTVDTELNGKTLKGGDKVVLWYTSANDDESHFANPGEFQPDRSPNDHVAFGLHSPHLCLGAHLARLEMRVLFEELANRWQS
jgi:cytochrome P450